MFCGLTPGSEPSTRHTSRNIDAPEPPAIEPTTRSQQDAVTAQGRGRRDAAVLVRCVSGIESHREQAVVALRQPRRLQEWLLHVGVEDAVGVVHDDRQVGMLPPFGDESSRVARPQDDETSMELIR